ncbi:MAG: hypothetical protein FJ338_02795 [Sphingomonadales bacterium]|nr:hypothetical protein [Sphingomonadales bacterium]MBM3931516.1 hypothetical protein [Sphingomonadales bacterium]
MITFRLPSRLLILVFVMMLGALTFIPSDSSAQCPMCKTSLESNRKDSEKAVGQGINKGILYLLAMPFLLVGTVGGLYWHRQRRFEEGQERRRRILEN